ncbi:BPI1 domain-containing protein [Pycnococcus provasolii]
MALLHLLLLLLALALPLPAVSSSSSSHAHDVTHLKLRLFPPQNSDESAPLCDSSSEKVPNRLRRWLARIRIRVPVLNVNLQGKADVQVRDLMCTGIELKTLAVVPVPGKTSPNEGTTNDDGSEAQDSRLALLARVGGLTLSCAANWHARQTSWPHIKASGGVAIALGSPEKEGTAWMDVLNDQLRDDDDDDDDDNIRVLVDVQSSTLMQQQSLPVPHHINVSSCTTRLAVTHLHFSGSSSWILDLLKEELASQLEQFLSSYVCDQTKAFLTKNGTDIVQDFVNRVVAPYAQEHVPAVFPDNDDDDGNSNSREPNNSHFVDWTHSAYARAAAFLADDAIGSEGMSAALTTWSRTLPPSATSPHTTEASLTLPMNGPSLWHAHLPLPSSIIAGGGSVKFSASDAAITIPVDGVARFAPLVVDGGRSASSLRGRLVLTQLDVQMNVCIDANAGSSNNKTSQNLKESFGVRASFASPISLDAAAALEVDARLWRDIQPTQYARDFGDCVVPALRATRIDNIDARGVAPASVSIVVEGRNSESASGALERQIDAAVSNIVSSALSVYSPTIEAALRGALNGPWRRAANTFLKQTLDHARNVSQPEQCPSPSADAPHWDAHDSGATGVVQILGYILAIAVVAIPVLTSLALWFIQCTIRFFANLRERSTLADSTDVNEPLIDTAPREEHEVEEVHHGRLGRRGRVLRCCTSFPPERSLAHQMCINGRVVVEKEGNNADDDDKHDFYDEDDEEEEAVVARRRTSESMEMNKNAPFSVWSIYAVSLMLAEIAIVAGLFLSSNLSVGAEIGGQIRVASVGSGDGNNATADGHSAPGTRGDLPVLFQFSLKSSVQEMWTSQVYFLAILIGLFSGIWPYAKLASLVACWMMPVALESSSWLAFSMFRRKQLLRVLDALGRWSLVDVYVMAMMIVAFRIAIHVSEDIMHLRSDDADSGGNSSSSMASVHLDLAVSPGWGIYGFVLAAFVSLVLSSAQLRCHYVIEEEEKMAASLMRRSLVPGAYENVSSEQQQQQEEEEEEDVGNAEGGCVSHVESSSVSPATGDDLQLVNLQPTFSPFMRRPGRLACLAVVSFFVLIASLTCFVIGMRAATVRISFDGATGWLLDASEKTSRTRDLSLYSLASAICSAAGAKGPWSRHGARLIQVVFIATTIVAPIAKLILTATWAALLCMERALCPSARATAAVYRPSSSAPHTFARVLDVVAASAEHARAFDGLDAFLVSVFAAVLELSLFAHAIVGHNCDAINSLLHRYMHVDSCFSVKASYVGIGAPLLLASLLLGWAGEACVGKLSDAWHAEDRVSLQRVARHRRQGSQMSEM